MADAKAETDKLADLLDQSETHRLILGDYSGPYSLGVTYAPGTRTGGAFVLKVSDPSGMPDSVTIRGQKIPVIVKGGFRAPEPL